MTMPKRFLFAITDWIVLPLRKVLPGYKRFDTSSVLAAYLIELEPDRAEGSSWYGGPGAGELVEWRPVLERAGVTACPNRTAAVYLELAVLVRALQGLDDAVRLDVVPDRSSLWAGLFDLRDTLLGATVDDLRALAA